VTWSATNPISHVRSSRMRAAGNFEQLMLDATGKRPIKSTFCKKFSICLTYCRTNSSGAYWQACLSSADVGAMITEVRIGTNSGDPT
jgi:hypothetical protein